MFCEVYCSFFSDDTDQNSINLNGQCYRDVITYLFGPQLEHINADDFWFKHFGRKVARRHNFMQFRCQVASKFVRFNGTGLISSKETKPIKFCKPQLKN